MLKRSMFALGAVLCGTALTVGVAHADMSTTTLVAYGTDGMATASAVIGGWIAASFTIIFGLIGLSFGYKFLKNKILGKRGGLAG